MHLLSHIRDTSALEVSQFHGIALYKTTFIYIYLLGLPYSRFWTKSHSVAPQASSLKIFILYKVESKNNNNNNNKNNNNRTVP